MNRRELLLYPRTMSVSTPFFGWRNDADDARVLALAGGPIVTFQVLPKSDRARGCHAAFRGRVPAIQIEAVAVRRSLASAHRSGPASLRCSRLLTCPNLSSDLGKSPFDTRRPPAHTVWQHRFSRLPSLPANFGPAYEAGVGAGTGVAAASAFDPRHELNCICKSMCP